MRQRLTLIAAVMVFGLVVFLMIRDMFQQQSIDSNPYEYTVERFKQIDTNDFCYELSATLQDNFNKLNGICIGPEDQLVLADSLTIRMYDASFNPIRNFNVGKEVTSIHMDDENRIIIGMGNQVETWNPDGKKISTWSAYNEKSILTSITSNEEMICVADAGTKRLLLYDKNGTFIKSMGEKDGDERKFGFLIPSPYFDVDISREGHFWATNPGLHTLEAYDTIGRLISSWNRTSMELDGFSGCCNPTHFSLLSNNHFVTVEKGLVRIKIHEPNGDFLCAVAGPLSFDEKESEMDLSVNSKDDIYVLVPSKKSVLKYQAKTMQ